MEKESTPELKRSLGPIDATMIVAGSMIGSGIFIVSSAMSRDVGSSGWMILLWLITGLITVAAALSYGELAGMMPAAGGQYVYLQRAYGSMIGFLYGWTVFTVIQTGVIAAVAVAFAKYTGVFIKEISPDKILLQAGFIKISSAQLLAIASIVLLTYINSRGVQSGKVIQVIFTSAKLFALLALIVLGIAWGIKGNTLSENFAHAWDASRTWLDKTTGQWHTEPIAGFALAIAMGSTIIYSLFSSDAWNNVTFIAGEIRDPQRNIPRSLFWGTFIVTMLYILANVAYLSLLPLKGDPAATDVIGQGMQFAPQDRVGTSAAFQVFGGAAAFIMAALIMVSTFGCNNGLVLSGARLFYAMSKDRLFFKKAQELNTKSVPSFALWLQCAWASVLCLSGKYSDLLTYSTFASLIFYMLTIGGIFILRKKEPLAPRPYKAFGYPLVPVLYIIVVLAICIDLLYVDTKNTGIGLAIVALGVPVYYLTRKTKPATVPLDQNL